MRLMDSWGGFILKWLFVTQWIWILSLIVLFIYQELSAEKAKVASVETRLSSQLSKREQEMVALQARMQASYQDHVAQTQRLNAKVSLIHITLNLKSQIGIFVFAFFYFMVLWVIWLLSDYSGRFSFLLKHIKHYSCERAAAPGLMVS